MPDTLAAKIKAKYPGAYDDVPDAELEAKIKAKYPGAYDDIPTSGNFSESGTTKNQDQGPPDPWADLRARGEAILGQDERQHTEPTPGMAGFVKGLSGNSDLHLTGQQSVGHAAGDLLSAENAGAVLHDAGTMAAGLLVPGGLKAGGKGLEMAGRAAGSGPGALAMRSMTGSTIGSMIHGPMGAAAGAAGAVTIPPMLRGFGRVMQRTGEAMSEPSSAPSEPILPQYRDLGNVPQYTDLGNPNAPAPRPPPAQLNAAPSGPFQSPPSSMGPARGFLAEAPPPPTMPPPSLASEQQAAMLDQLNGPAPLGSLPASQSPRVKAWKPGFGPSAGDAEVLRNAYGSKQAGSILKTRGDQVKTLAPTDGPPTLPAQVSESLGQQFLAASPEVRQQLLSTASPLVKQLFLSLAERSP